MSQFPGGYSLSSDQQLNNTMQSIGFTLLSKNSEWFKDSNLSFPLLGSPDINTFVHNGNPICVTEGLLSQFPRAETAFLMGKEMCETLPLSKLRKDSE